MSQKSSPAADKGNVHKYVCGVYWRTCFILRLFCVICSRFIHVQESDRFYGLESPLESSWRVFVECTLPIVASVTLLVVWLFTLTVTPFVISRFSSLIYEERVARYTIGASVALYLLVASGVRNINWRYAKIAVIAAIVILSAVNLQSYYYLRTTHYYKG